MFNIVRVHFSIFNIPIFVKYQDPQAPYKAGHVEIQIDQSITWVFLIFQ